MKVKLTALFFIILSSITLQAKKHCACGNFVDGITTYSVRGKDCCSDLKPTSGRLITYAYNEGNEVYEVIDKEDVDEATVRENCCD